MEHSGSDEMDVRIALSLREDFKQTCEPRAPAETLSVLIAFTASRAMRLKPSMRQSWTISTPLNLAASALLLAGMGFTSLDRLFCSHQTRRCRYRRGKPSSNDIDIVFTHPTKMSAKGLCARLVERLRSAGLVTYVMRTSCSASLCFIA